MNNINIHACTNIYVFKLRLLKRRTGSVLEWNGCNLLLLWSIALKRKSTHDESSSTR